MNISETFIRRPIATSLLMLGIALFGVIAYEGLPVSDLPQVDYPTITVNASLPGANPDTLFVGAVPLGAPVCELDVRDPRCRNLFRLDDWQMNVENVKAGAGLRWAMLTAPSTYGIARVCVGISTRTPPPKNDAGSVPPPITVRP